MASPPDVRQGQPDAVLGEAALAVLAGRVVVPGPGVSEFAARLPSFLVAILLVAATVWFAGGLWGRQVAILAGIILATSAGIVPALRGLRTGRLAGGQHHLAMIAFAQFVRSTGRPQKAWALGFFLALASAPWPRGRWRWCWWG